MDVAVSNGDVLHSRLNSQKTKEKPKMKLQTHFQPKPKSQLASETEFKIQYCFLPHEQRLFAVLLTPDNQPIRQWSGDNLHYLSDFYQLPYEPFEDPIDLNEYSLSQPADFIGFRTVNPSNLLKEPADLGQLEFYFFVHSPNSNPNSEKILLITFSYSSSSWETVYPIPYDCFLQFCEDPVALAYQIFRIPYRREPKLGQDYEVTTARTLLSKISTYYPSSSELS